MSGFELNEWIVLPPKAVFDFVTDANNAPKVVSSVKSMVKLTEGPTDKGTRYRETRMMNGKEQEAELEVVAFEPSEKYAVRNETQGFETTYTYTLTPEKNGTRIKLVCDVKAGGLKKMTVPMVVSILKKEDGDHLQRLKKAMEQD